MIRDFSRQEYLKKREEKKIEELEADLLDAETIFAGEKLSRKEIEEIEYKRTVLDLAKKRKQAQEDLNRDDGYHMPTAYDKEGAAPSERYKVLTERYRCYVLFALSICMRCRPCMHRNSGIDWSICVSMQSVLATLL